MKAYVASDLKDMNRRTVFQLSRKLGELSRVDISRITGISPPTVMKITNSFTESGILVISGEMDTAVGRKPQLLRFNPDAAFSIGVEFEGEYLRVGLVNLEGSIKSQLRRKVSQEFGPTIVQEVVACIRHLMENFVGSEGPVLGIGMGIPGVVDIDNRIIKFAPLVGISNPYHAGTICNEIEQQTGLPVFIENDVNAAAIGEYVVRRMSKDSDLLFISIGTGLGAGIILNGELRRGSSNMAGEMGYYVPDAYYNTDRSRPGWLESQVNLDALMKRFGFIIGQEIEAGELPDGMVDYIVDRLAPCIANMATQLDIGLVVIGGVIAEFMNKQLTTPLNQVVQRLCLCDVLVDLQKAAEPGVTGLASLASEAMLDEFLGGDIDFIP